MISDDPPFRFRQQGVDWRVLAQRRDQGNLVKLLEYQCS
jgi:hypothetical protein